MSRYRQIAALGSSYAAGPGITPVADARAMRSERNYAHLVAAGLGADLTDLTISGATTDTIVDTRQRMLWRSFSPQIDGLPADTDLVTVTAGGNDLNYLGSMLRIALVNSLRTHAWERPVDGILRGAGAATAGPGDVERAAAGLTRIVETVRARAPRARVILVDYLTIVGDQTTHTADTPFDPAELAAFQRLGQQLTQAFADAAAITGADLVRASELSTSHALGSREPWIFGLKRWPLTAIGSSFHPNVAGMRAVADEILRTVES